MYIKICIYIYSYIYIYIYVFGEVPSINFKSGY